MYKNLYNSLTYNAVTEYYAINMLKIKVDVISYFIS